MRIRTQNLLAIGPLFLFLALVSSALMVHTERRELRWGYREEAGALAVATAEFIDGDLYRGMAARGVTTPVSPRLRMSLDRILARNQARRIFGLTADGRRVVFSFGGSPIDLPRGSVGLKQAPTPVPSPKSWGRGEDPAAAGRHPSHGAAQAENGNAPHFIPPPPAFGGGGQGAGADRVFVTDIHPLSPGHAVLMAYAPIHDSAGKLVGVLGIETDASGFLAATRRNLLRGAGVTGIVGLLGLIVVTALSAMVTREVKELTGAAVEVRQGNLERRIRSGRIQEVADLGNTFNTMTEVLQDVLARTKRSLSEGEQFRTEADLARAYVERFWAPLRLELGGAQVGARHVGQRPAGAFYGAFETRGGASCAIVGRVRSTGELGTVIEASTACSLLRQELANGEPESVFPRIAEQFSFELLECLCWRPGQDEATHWRLTADAETPEHRTLTLRPGTALALHPLAGETGATIQRYVHAFDHLPPEELLADLAAVLPPGLEGSLLVVSRSGS